MTSVALKKEDFNKMGSYYKVHLHTYVTINSIIIQNVQVIIELYKMHQFHRK